MHEVPRVDGEGVPADREGEVVRDGAVERPARACAGAKEAVDLGEDVLRAADEGVALVGVRLGEYGGGEGGGKAYGVDECGEGDEG